MELKWILTGEKGEEELNQKVDGSNSSSAPDSSVSDLGPTGKVNN